MGIFKGKILRAGLSPEALSVRFLKDNTCDVNNYAAGDVILGLGERPLFHFTGRRSIDKWHLSPLLTKNGALFIGSYDFGRIQKQYELGLYLEMALQKVAKYAKTKYTPPEENFHLNPQLGETLAILEEIKDMPKLAVDVETGYGQINTVGFAWTKRDAIAINTLPGRCSSTAYYTLWDAIRVFSKVDLIKFFKTSSTTLATSQDTE